MEQVRYRSFDGYKISCLELRRLEALAKTHPVPAAYRTRWPRYCQVFSKIVFIDQRHSVRTERNSSRTNGRYPCSCNYRNTEAPA